MAAPLRPPFDKRELPRVGEWIQRQREERRRCASRLSRLVMATMPSLDVVFPRGLPPLYGTTLGATLAAAWRGVGADHRPASSAAAKKEKVAATAAEPGAAAADDSTTARDLAGNPSQVETRRARATELGVKPIVALAQSGAEGVEMRVGLGKSNALGVELGGDDTGVMPSPLYGYDALVYESTSSRAVAARTEVKRATTRAAPASTRKRSVAPQPSTEPSPLEVVGTWLLPDAAPNDYKAVGIPVEVGVEVGVEATTFAAPPSSSAKAMVAMETGDGVVPAPAAEADEAAETAATAVTKTTAAAPRRRLLARRMAAYTSTGVANGTTTQLAASGKGVTQLARIFDATTGVLVVNNLMRLYPNTPNGVNLCRSLREQLRQLHAGEMLRTAMSDFGGFGGELRRNFGLSEDEVATVRETEAMSSEMVMNTGRRTLQLDLLLREAYVRAYGAAYRAEVAVAAFERAFEACGLRCLDGDGALRIAIALRVASSVAWGLGAVPAQTRAVGMATFEKLLLPAEAIKALKKVDEREVERFNAAKDCAEEEDERLAAWEARLDETESENTDEVERFNAAVERAEEENERLVAWNARLDERASKDTGELLRAVLEQALLPEARGERAACERDDVEFTPLPDFVHKLVCELLPRATVATAAAATAHQHDVGWPEPTAPLTLHAAKCVVEAHAEAEVRALCSSWRGTADAECAAAASAAAEWASAFTSQGVELPKEQDSRADRTKHPDERDRQLMAHACHQLANVLLTQSQLVGIASADCGEEAGVARVDHKDKEYGDMSTPGKYNINNIDVVRAKLPAWDRSLRLSKYGTWYEELTAAETAADAQTVSGKRLARMRAEMEKAAANVARRSQKKSAEKKSADAAASSSDAPNAESPDAESPRCPLRVMLAAANALVDAPQLGGVVVSMNAATATSRSGESHWIELSLAARPAAIVVLHRLHRALAAPPATAATAAAAALVELAM